MIGRGEDFLSRWYLFGYYAVGSEKSLTDLSVLGMNPTTIREPGASILSLVIARATLLRYT